jgi:hypothetical protein
MLAERIRHATRGSACVLGSRIQPLWGGYGDLWRAELSQREQLLSVIVKDVRPPPDDGSLAHRRKLRSYRVEQAFYARYAARCGAGCRVPRALGLSAEAGGFLTVLEDLDAAGFSERRRRASEEQRQDTLRWLAAFHATFLGEPAEELWKVGTYWHVTTRPDELARISHAALCRAAPAIDTRLNAARFRTLVHGDAKLENVCFGPAGTVALVDFQYVGGGVGVKDVAYFLSSCLASGECATLVPRYLDLYFVALEAELAGRLETREIDALQREWRELFPLAWVDFYRFLLGWAPGRYEPDPFSDALVAQVLPRLRGHDE